MVTKLDMIKTVAQRVTEQQKKSQTLYENLLILHDNNATATDLCLESMIDILGAMQARMSVGKSPFDATKDPKHQRLLVGLVAAAKILRDVPDAVEAHNMTPNRLRQAMVGAGEDMDATRMLLQVAQSSPTVASEVYKSLSQFEQAVSQGDEKTASAIAADIKKLWLHWQRQLASIKQ